MKPVLPLLLAGIAAFGTAGSAFAREEICHPTSEKEILGLFERWNDALKTGDAHAVVALYAEKSVLLPTVSNIPRETPEQKLEYFKGFLKRHPTGHINHSWIELDCNTAIDSGLYTFTYGDGTEIKARFTYTYKRFDKQWLITSHHSSISPE